MGRPDWPLLREQYRTTTKSLRELASEHAVSERALFARSKAEGWPQMRVDHQEQIAARVQRETEDRQVRQAVDTMTTVSTIGRAVLTHFGRLVNARAVELTASDFVNVAKLVLLLEGKLPAERADVLLRRMGEKPPEELTDDELDTELAELADRWLRERTSADADQGESTA